MELIGEHNCAHLVQHSTIKADNGKRREGEGERERDSDLPTYLVDVIAEDYGSNPNW